MFTFSEVNMARLAIKMKLSQYAWFDSTAVIFDNSEYSIMVKVTDLNNNVRKIVPHFYNGISVRVVK